MFSQAEEVARWVRKRHHWKRFGAIGYVVLSVIFLGWRISVFNWQAPVLSTFFIALEFLGAVMGWGTVFSTWWFSHQTPRCPKRRYTVDVLLPVYTEPLEMIELTVIGAKSIDYQHETFLLDDGHREELRQLAAKHGVHYLSREGNKGAKAGNLNHGLAHSSGEIVAVFDADHVAQREALEKMLGFFDDEERLGMIQAPQMFYNEDAFIFSKVFVGAGLRHEQSFFFDLVLSSRDAVGAVSGIGTGAMFRRSALEDIGGFPELTLTEDIHTSLLLSRNGWVNRYLNEPVAWGVGAADVPEYYRTRHRWAHGNMQAIRQEGIFTRPGLPWKVRVNYMCMGIQYLDGLHQLGYMLIPAYSMMTYQAPFLLTPQNVIIALGMPLLLIWFITLTGMGWLNFYRRQVFAIGRMHLSLAALSALFGKNLRWNVAVKNVIGIVSWGVLTPQIIMLILGVLAILLSLKGVVWNWLHHEKLPLHSFVALYGSLWMGYNVVRLIDWLRSARGLLNRKGRDYLFEVSLPLLDSAGRCVARTSRISHLEVMLEAPNPSLSGTSLTLLLPGEHISIKLEPSTDGTLHPYTFNNEAQRMILQRSLYSADWHRQIRLAPHCETTREAGLQGPWQTAVLNLSGSPQWSVCMREPNSLTLITAAPLNPGQPFTLDLASMEGGTTCKGTITGEITPPYKIPRDLNDHQCRIFAAEMV